MTTAVAENRWHARPYAASALRVVLLAVPLLASSAAVYGLARWLPADAATSWWGLGAMLALGLLVAVGVERGTRRLLPIALLLKLSMIFPDRAPSRLRLARAAATRPREELVWPGRTLEPATTTDLVLALIGALGAHDRRTRGHSERVRLLCDVLAVEIGLDEHDRDRLRWSALLHDVGKVEVSSRILNKPTRLDEAEFDEVRLHPAAGAALATPLLPWLGTWGDGILDHHERFDGTGYPHGKAGDEISEAGRLIAVIDAFETMTAARPYKKAMATRAAREELARCAGKHFDPLYVRAFLAVSLPRLLWAMGPVSFVLQLPFLSSLAQSGLRAGTTVPQAAGALAAGAAGAAVIA
ncbi:MAG: domain/HD domain protein, partial [Frankiales bacterium]|nr:domain/HD domain protein [Frankiales bacterium]